MILCTATWEVEPGEEVEVLAALGALAPASRAELGCHTYLVHQDAAEPSVFRIVEVYDDEDALRAHRESAHFRKHALGRAVPRLADRQALVTTILDV